MSKDLVLYDSSDSIATIALNRRDKLHALSNGLVAQLRDALIRFQASADRVAILTSRAIAWMFAAPSTRRKRPCRGRHLSPTGTYCSARSARKNRGRPPQL